ncbi:hypothetical protein SLS58_006434 [Diplodia intermedia]|uniref:Uncharacterized protein n=1 Tax=Diplodia intermedia TaxID=856260 RepID=A0ABR3TN80_9PEZI
MRPELLASVIAGAVIFGLMFVVGFGYMLYRAFQQANSMDDITGVGRHNNSSLTSFELAELGRAQGAGRSMRSQSSMNSLHTGGGRRSARSNSLTSTQPSNNSRVNLHRQTSADSIGVLNGRLPDFMDPKAAKKNRSKSAESRPPLSW